MKKKFLPIVTLLVLTKIAYSTDGPVTTAGSPAICFGTAISIPVTVTQFTDVGVMSLTLNYNPSDLVYQEVSVNTDFPGVETDGSIPGIFTLEWVDLTQTGISLDPNEVLFTLTFTLATGFTQGSTDFTWVEDPSSANVYSDPEGIEYDKSPFGSFFIGGTLTVNPLPVPGITGDNNPCPGLTGVQYSTEPGMSGYQWTVTGGTIIAGGCTGDNIVTVMWCTGESGVVMVNYTNSYGCTGVTSTAYPVTVESPVAPGATWTGGDFTVPVSRDGCSAEVSWLTTVPDHNQTVTRGNLGAWELYQSITAGQTGLLTKISLNVVRTNENFRLKVYAGAGVSGELMFWGDYKTAPSAGWQDYILPQNAAPYIVSGNQYTLYFECLTKPYTASSWLAFGCNWIGDNLGCWIIAPIEPPLHCGCPAINANNNYWDNMPVYGVLPEGSEFSPSLEMQLKTWVSQLPLSITETCGYIKSVTVSDTSGSAFPHGETTVTYTVTNNGDQFAESFFDVFVATDLTGSAGNDGPVCEGAALTLTAGGGGGGGGYTYNWIGPDDVTYTGSPLVIPAASVAQHNGEWKVDITDIYDCTVRETTTVTVNALQLDADFTADSLLPLKYSTVQLTDLSTSGATSWEWSFDRDSVEYVNGTNEHSQNPQVQFTDGGLYTVTLMVSSACSTDTEVKTGYIRVGRPGWWTGETSKNWHYSKNWDNHLVPDGGIDVIIPTIEPGCFNPHIPHNLVTNVDCSNLIFVGEAVLEVEGELIVNPGTEVIVKDSATIMLIDP